MKMRQPLALLLGGLLSASGIGCSAMNALTSHAGSKAAGGRPSAERLASIGRVFENQGRYDQAEVMYRKALKQNPNDQIIADQLSQLAAKREGRHFGPSKTANAIALADSVSGGRGVSRNVIRQPEASSPAADLALALPAAPAENAVISAEQWVSPPEQKTADVGTTDWTHDPPKAGFAVATSQALPFIPENVTSRSDVSPAAMVAHDPDVSPGIHRADFAPVSHPAPLADAEQSITAVEQSPSSMVTTQELLATVSNPQGTLDLLLKALDHGDSVETKTLAAALLGECDPSDTTIRTALARQLETATEHGLVLAIADSQIQRGEANNTTAECMTAIAGCSTSGHQVQAITGLRYFSETGSQSICVQTLRELLTCDSQDVRAAAAVTLGDFASNDDITLAALTELAAEDNDPGVRRAALAAISRRTIENTETAEGILIQSAR